MIPRGIHDLQYDWGFSSWLFVHSTVNQGLDSKKSRSKAPSNSALTPSVPGSTDYWGYLSRAYRRYTQASMFMTVMKYIRGTPSPIGLITILMFAQNEAMKSPPRIAETRKDLGIALNTPGYISGMTTF